MPILNATSLLGQLEISGSNIGEKIFIVKVFFQHMYLLIGHNIRNVLNLRLTRRSGSAGVAGSSYSTIALLFFPLISRKLSKLIYLIF